MRDKKIGLTLGKYAPFHKGHQYVVNTALAEMDHVIVVIYDCPETYHVPLQVRANWIRRLYPKVEVIEAWDGPTEIGDTPEIKAKHEAYILKLLGERCVTHFYSSEFYGEHMSIALQAKNRLVDVERINVPVSGTLIRENPYELRAYIEPVVYRDLITNIVFLGAPSTGKSTIAERLAKEYLTVWMPEYGREYWEEHQENRRLTMDQLVELAEEHIAREEELLLNAKGYLFTDTNVITTYMFSQYYHGEAHPELQRLANDAAMRYDLVFLCEDDIPYDDTWDRSGEMQRQVFQKQIRADLLERRIPFIPLHGDLDERMKKVKGNLQRYRKYQSILG